MSNQSPSRSYEWLDRLVRLTREMDELWTVYTQSINDDSLIVSPEYEAFARVAEQRDELLQQRLGEVLDLAVTGAWERRRKTPAEAKGNKQSG